MENCLFCKIADGSIPSKKVYEDDTVLAFFDIAPAAPVHTMTLPATLLSRIAFMLCISFRCLEKWSLGFL